MKGAAIKRIIMLSYSILCIQNIINNRNTFDKSVILKRVNNMSQTVSVPNFIR